MKNKFKIIYLLIISLFVTTACLDTNDDVDLQEAVEATNGIQLLNPGVTSLTLNRIQSTQNAFSLAWNDNSVEGQAPYSVVMSPNASFEPMATLTSTDMQNYSMSIEEFNQALSDLGYQPYTTETVYISILTDQGYSEMISFSVSTYPTEDPTLVSLSDGSTLTLSPDNSGESVGTFSWEDYDYSLSDGSVSYELQFALAGTDFADPVSPAPISSTELEMIQQDLNLLAIEAGIEAETTGSLEARVVATVTDPLGETFELISNINTYTITTYPGVLDLSTTWGIVGDATVNGWAGPDVPFFQTEEDNVYVAYPYLTTGEMKFRENNDWAVNYGDNGADGTLEDGGSNIVISTEGSYKIIIDLNNLTYTMELYSLGMVGDATPNGWGGPDVQLMYDQYSDTFKAIVEFSDGEMKFRLNNDWAVNYGDNGADGTLEDGGSNIAVTAGKYIVTVSLSDMTYSLEAIDHIWGIIGDFNGWAQDMTMNRDWSQPNYEIWKIEGVNFTDGGFKFRADNNWDYNYGDDGADGTIEAGGANIAITAGVYDVELNLTANTYTVTAQ